MSSIAPAKLPFTILLGLIAGLPALSIDLSAPTLALLPSALDTTVFVAGLTLSLFVLGFGLGQYVGGRGSDRFGRRPVLLAALIVYALAGLCCSFATTGVQLATARLLQGFGAGASSVQAFAMVQDLFTGQAARRKQAYVSVVLTVMPMVAPALGAVLIEFTGWRSVHVAMAIGAATLLGVVAFGVAETRVQRPNRIVRGLGLIESADMMRQPAFRSITVVNALSYAAIFAYIAGAPVIVIAQMHLGNVVYASVFACTAAALSAGAFLSARLSSRIPLQRLVGPALLVQTAASVALVGASLGSTAWAAWTLLPILLVGCFARGIISPNLVSAAIAQNRDQAGLAAALYGLAQLMTAAVASAVLARVLESVGPAGLALTMTVLTGTATLVWMVGDVGAVLAEQG